MGFEDGDVVVHLGILKTTHSRGLAIIFVASLHLHIITVSHIFNSNKLVQVFFRWYQIHFNITLES